MPDKFASDSAAAPSRELPASRAWALTAIWVASVAVLWVFAGPVVALPAAVLLGILVLARAGDKASVEGRPMESERPLRGGDVSTQEPMQRPLVAEPRKAVRTPQGPFVEAPSAARLSRSRHARVPLLKTTYAEPPASDVLLRVVDLSRWVATLGVVCVVGGIGLYVAEGGDGSGADLGVTLILAGVVILTGAAICLLLLRVASAFEQWAHAHEMAQDRALAQHTFLMALVTATDLSGVDLAGRDLSCAFLPGKRLVGARLPSAKMDAAELARADLSEADLVGADLSRANLAGARFVAANLASAKLTGADIRDTDLSEAILRAADLRGTDLSRVHSLRGADLNNARYDNRTTWPHGFDPHARGAVAADDET